MFKKHPFIFGFAGLLIYTVVDDHIRYTKACEEHSQWEKERDKRLKAYSQVQKEIKDFK
jgi:hypothetical protein